MNGSDPLFRPQALAFRRNAGEPAVALLQRPRLSLWVSWLFAANLLALLLVVVTLDYRSTASAPGVLHGEGVAQRISASRTAMIQAIHVEEGESVSPGDILATLVSQSHDHAGDPESMRAVAHLQGQRALLRRELELQTRRFEQAGDRLRRQRAAKQQQRRQLAEERRLLQAQLDLVGDELARLATLVARRAIASGDYQRRQLELLARKRDASEALRRQQELDLTLGDLDAQLDLLASDHAGEVLALEKQLADINHRLQESRHGAVTTLVAERAGQVSTIAFATGAVVRAGQAVFYLSAANAPLLAEVWAPSRVAARLESGQSLMLRLDAFDYRHYGRLPGVIRRVSRAPLDPREHLLPVTATQEALFRIDVALPEAGLWQEADLPPGTTLVADFVLEEKSLLAFILEPVLRLRGKVS